MLVTYICIIAVVAYLMGGINGAITASKRIYKKDIRKYGSGNPGLTNFYRVFGKGGAAIVIIIDVMKTVLPVLLGWWLLGRCGHPLTGRLIAGFFAMLGHAYPVFYNFKGGKTVMAGGTLLILIDWRVALVGWGVFVLMVVLTKYVSLGSMLAGISLPVSLLVFKIGTWYDVLLGALCGGLLVFRHKENIKRLVKGEESKLVFKKEKNKNA